VAAHRGLRELQGAHQIGDSQFAAFQQPEQTEPGWITEGPERAHERVQRLASLIHSFNRIEGYITGAAGRKLSSRKASRVTLRPNLSGGSA